MYRGHSIQPLILLHLVETKKKCTVSKVFSAPHIVAPCWEKKGNVCHCCHIQVQAAEAASEDLQALRQEMGRLRAGGQGKGCFACYVYHGH